MFEDVEKFLSENRKPVKGNEGELVGQEDLPNHIIEQVQEISETYKTDDIKVRRVKGGYMLEVAGATPKEDTLAENIANSLMVLGKQLGATPVCADANGLSLKEGDVLLCHDGTPKKVLSVGYGFCELTRSDNNKRDGYWFQNEIIKRGFALKK